MRRAAKVDANQTEIVKALRQVGASVQSLAATGKGCPDLLVGIRGLNFLIEVKDGAKPRSDRKLTAALKSLKTTDYVQVNYVRLYYCVFRIALTGHWEL